MKDFQITLIDKKEICDNTVAFWFDTKNMNYKFEAGQYAHFTLINPKYEDSKGNSRALSIATSPLNEKIMIAARKNSSVFINNLFSIPIGSNVYISKPSGNLKLHKEISTSAVFIAGGIGITPIRSIIEQVIENKIPYEIFLFYSNKSETQSAFLKDFESWAITNKNFYFVPVIDDLENKKWNYEYGPMDKRLLQKYLKTFEDKIYYIVGPPLMVDTINGFLLSEGVPMQKIKIEKFR